MDMGKAYLRAGDYDSAMECFELVGEKEYYSKAFAGKRSGSMGWYLVLVPLCVALLAFGFSRVLRRIQAANRADDLIPPTKIGLKRQLQYAFVPIYHPFDGFYEMKRHGRGGVLGALVIFAAATFCALASQYLSGYLYSDVYSSDTNLLLEAAQFLFPFLLLIVANYCVTSLLDGEGRFRDIFVTVGYSLLPLVLLLPLFIVAANFLSLDEGVILTLIQIIAYGWSILLIFWGLLTSSVQLFEKRWGNNADSTRNANYRLFADAVRIFNAKIYCFPAECRY